MSLRHAEEKKRERGRWSEGKIGKRKAGGRERRYKGGKT
jgi:hypothetical protein